MREMISDCDRGGFVAILFVLEIEIGLLSLMLQRPPWGPQCAGFSIRPLLFLCHPPYV